MKNTDKNTRTLVVLTGDIVNSKKVKPESWLKPLKQELEKLGKAPRYWEIYRGDSFQVRVDNPELALETVIKIKAALKSLKPLDIRVAMGVGHVSNDADRVTEANGTAFIHSGEKFELLKKQKQNIAIKSDWKNFDDEMNLYFRLALIAMDNWTVNSAEIVKIAMENPGKSQEDLGHIVGLKQNAISRRLKRAYYDELMELNERYKLLVKALV